MAEILLDPSSVESYGLFLKIKCLPRYRVRGRVAQVPDEYLASLGLPSQDAPSGDAYAPAPYLFDYQRDVAGIAVRKRKFAFFARPGIGKTPVMWEFARHAAGCLGAGRCFLAVTPLMVIDQAVAEAERFYGGSLRVERVRPKDLPDWLESGGRDARGACAVGITNYESVREGLRPGRLGGLALDESSLLKSHYGAYGRRLIELGRGLEWKLCLTGTPAPNDRIEYANHAVFLDRFPNVNSFLAKYFVNRGKTSERWELKPHALRPFYRSLSDWCLFLSDPATYGWRDNVNAFPPVRVRVHDVPLTARQEDLLSRAGGFGKGGGPGGITTRGRLAQLAKGLWDGHPVETNKPAFIRGILESAECAGRSAIVWCRYNHEQDGLARELGGRCLSVSGATKPADRAAMIAAFQRREAPWLLTKPKILGFGLNMQVATVQVFNGLWDSYEEYAQAVARSNRVGSTETLDVHIPVTPVERPMMDSVLRKAGRVEDDTREQEQLFKEVMYAA